MVEEPPLMRRSSSQVSFGDVEIREYELALGDNPSCRDGPAVQLGWRYSEGAPEPIKQYEEQREGFRRDRFQMALPASHRQDLLREFGYSHNEMQEAQKEAKKVSQGRFRTAIQPPMVSKAEEIIESAKRKFSQSLLGRKRNSNPNVLMP